jgi:GTP pyrophosphokinase
MKHSHFQGHIDKNDFDRLYAELSKGVTEKGHLAALDHALRYALQVQDDQDPRPSAIDVAIILKHIGVDAETLIATLLSDPRLRDKLDEQTVHDEFDKTIANLVGHINWLNTFKECTEEEPQAPEQAETLRRMLLATVDDVRAVLVKLAYRVQRLRGLPQEAPAVRRCIARETMDIYTALANRLGVAQLKWEMEDLSFRHLEPVAYKDLAKSMNVNRAEREAYVDAFVEELLGHISEAGIDARVYGRPKHLYSIWRKMKRKQVQLDELADLLAVRVVVENVPQCYLVLGVVHGLWKHLPNEFDDYIANPKENGYQSLHTAVIGPDGRVVEVQIRTREMHEFAEHGVAAHWRYKEGSKQDQAMESMINALRRLLENRDEDEDDESLLEDLNAELFSDRVFVLTPKGRVLDLPKGATPLDFAYAIHTEVGNRSRGARVDGHIVPLNYQLKSGERVEILTGKEAHPSRDWMDSRLGYLVSPRSRAKVRRWFKLQDYDLNVHDGREILDREVNHLHLGHIDLDELAKHFNLVQGDDLLAALGSADISIGQLVSALRVPSLPDEGLHLGRRFRDRGKEAESTDAVTIQGVGNLMTNIGNCCKPVPGDPIIGYITQGKGVTIHRQDCPNILSMPQKRRRRLVEVSWGGAPRRSTVMIHIEAFDRQGLLRDITQVLSNARVNVLGANTRTDSKDQSVHMGLTIEVTDTGQLSLVLDRIASLPNVFDVRRAE